MTVINSQSRCLGSGRRVPSVRGKSGSVICPVCFQKRSLKPSQVGDLKIVWEIEPHPRERGVHNSRLSLREAGRRRVRRS